MAEDNFDPTTIAATAAMREIISKFDEGILRAAKDLKEIPEPIWGLLIDGSKGALVANKALGAAKDNTKDLTEAQIARANDIGIAYLDLCLTGRSFLRAAEVYAEVKVKNMILAREERRAKEEG